MVFGVESIVSVWGYDGLMHLFYLVLFVCVSVVDKHGIGTLIIGLV